MHHMLASAFHHIFLGEPPHFERDGFSYKYFGLSDVQVYLLGKQS